MQEINYYSHKRNKRYCFYNYVKVILLSWNLYYDISGVVKRENIQICPNGLPPIAHKVECAMLRDVYSGSECVTTVIIKFSR